MIVRANPPAPAHSITRDGASLLTKYSTPGVIDAGVRSCNASGGINVSVIRVAAVGDSTLTRISFFCPSMCSTFINPTIALLKSELARTTAPDRRDRVELLGIDFHWPNASMTHGLDHTLGYNPLRLGDYSRATGAGDHIALPDQRTFSALFPGYRSLLADMLGLRFIASRVPLEEVDKTLRAGTFRQVGRTPDAYIFENPGALPRAIVVQGAVAANTDTILATGIWPRDFDPRRTVILPELPAPAPCAAPAQTTATSSAVIKIYRNTEITIEVTSPGCGYLVLNDVWQRWWSAEVNGESEPVLKANVLFRAVAIPAGRSTVVFSFDPFAGLATDIASRTPAPVTRFITNSVVMIDRWLTR